MRFPFPRFSELKQLILPSGLTKLKRTEHIYNTEQMVETTTVDLKFENSYDSSHES